VAAGDQTKDRTNHLFGVIGHQELPVLEHDGTTLLAGRRAVDQEAIQLGRGGGGAPPPVDLDRLARRHVVDLERGAELLAQVVHRPGRAQHDATIDDEHVPAAYRVVEDLALVELDPKSTRSSPTSAERRSRRSRVRGEGHAEDLTPRRRE